MTANGRVGATGIFLPPVASWRIGFLPSRCSARSG
jgi:hypothetical protein